MTPTATFELDDHITAHVLRHTFATMLVRGGTDLVIVAELLGHGRLETTRGYTRPTAEDPFQSARPAHHRAGRPKCGFRAYLGCTPVMPRVQPVRSATTVAGMSGVTANNRRIAGSKASTAEPGPCRS